MLAGNSTSNHKRRVFQKILVKLKENFIRSCDLKHASFKRPSLLGWLRDYNLEIRNQSFFLLKFSMSSSVRSALERVLEWVEGGQRPSSRQRRRRRTAGRRSRSPRQGIQIDSAHSPAICALHILHHREVWRKTTKWKKEKREGRNQEEKEWFGFVNVFFCEKRLS